MAARKVWAVSSGEYSDYRVGFLYETEELAMANVGSGYVEEFFLFDADPLKVSYVDLWGYIEEVDGAVVVTRNTERLGTIHPEAEESHPAIKVHFYASSREQKWAPRINVFITGTDIKRCRKAMSEYLARGVAQFHIITATDESAKASEINT